MEACKYSLKLRNNMDERRFEVTDNELLLRSYKKGTKRIALKNVTAVRLTRVQGRSFCAVTAPGKARIDVPSPAEIDRNYSEETNVQFQTFIKCLHEKIAASGARPTWTAGSNGLYVLGIISFVLVGISILVFLAGLLLTNKAPFAVLTPAVLLSISGVPLMQKGKAKPYLPTSIPKEYLTDTQSGRNTI